jgi:hypothetical protein
MCKVEMLRFSIIIIFHVMNQLCLYMKKSRTVGSFEVSCFMLI